MSSDKQVTKDDLEICRRIRRASQVAKRLYAISWREHRQGLENMARVELILAVKARDKEREMEALLRRAASEG